MALWNRVRSNVRIMGQLLEFYGNPQRQFPIEVREIFANHIEEAVCGPGIKDTFSISKGFDPDNPDHHEFIKSFLKTLTVKLEAQLGNIQAFQFLSVVWKLRQILPLFKERTQKEPLEFFRSIRENVQFEIDLISKASSTSQPHHRITPDIFVVSLDVLRHRIDTAGAKLKQFQAQNRQGFYKPYLPSILREYEETISSVINGLSEIVKRFLEERVSMWKFQQQHLALGIHPPEKAIELDDLQNPSELIFAHLISILSQLKEAEEDCRRFPSCIIPIANLKSTVTRVLEIFVRETFVVTRQPPIVIKQELRLPEIISACLLVGRLILPLKDSQVTMSIIGEAQAKELFESGPNVIGQFRSNKGCRGSFEKGTDVANLVVDMDTSRVNVSYEKVKLMARVRDGARRGGGVNQFVMEEKFCLLFRLTVDIMDLCFETWTTSLPVTVSTHKSQNSHGAATVIWDYATAKPNRIPFEVSETISWKQLSQILSSLIQKSCGVGLTQDHLAFLQEKLFTGYPESTEEIPWSEFTKRKFVTTKDSSSEKGFSFWDWFYGALIQLEGKQLCPMWERSLIEGFISREGAHAKLRGSKTGTFLIRFACSAPASISIAYVDCDSRVLSLKPFLLRELQSTTLADFIKELNELEYLYKEPYNSSELGQQRKDEIFKDLYSRGTTGSSNADRENPYVSLKLVPRPPPMKPFTPQPKSISEAMQNPSRSNALAWNIWPGRVLCTVPRSERETASSTTSSPTPPPAEPMLSISTTEIPSPSPPVHSVEGKKEN